jgi:hypothetical protein
MVGEIFCAGKKGDHFLGQHKINSGSAIVLKLSRAEFLWKRQYPWKLTIAFVQ